MSDHDVPDSFTLVTQYFPPERGAAQVRLGSVVRELVRRGRSVQVVTALPNYPVGRIFDGWSRRPLQVVDERGARVARVLIWASMGSGVGRMVNYASFGLMSLLGLLATRRSRWVVVEYPTLFGALPAVILARLRRQRLVIIVADLWVDSIVEMGAVPGRLLTDVLRQVERWMLRRAHVVTAVTEGVRDALVAKGVDPAKMAWLPNGADAEMFSPGPVDCSLREDLGLVDGEHLVLYAGTHGYVHGLEVVLDAAALLTDVPVRFVLVGDGSEKTSLRQQAAARGLEKVEFREPVDPEEVARMLRGATAGLATVREGDVYRTIRSAKMLPTMATARPVLYSGDDEGARLVGQLGAGLVTPPGDALALAQAVRRLIAEEGLGDRLGRAGRAWVVEQASWQQLVGRWLDRLDEIDGRQPTGSGAEAAP